MNVRMPGTLKAARIIMAAYCALGALTTGLGVLTLFFAADMNEDLRNDPMAQDMLTAEELERLSAQNPALSLVLSIVVLVVFLVATFRVGRGGGAARTWVRLAATVCVLSTVVTLIFGGGFGLGAVFSIGLAAVLLLLNENRVSREWFERSGELSARS